MQSSIISLLGGILPGAGVAGADEGAKGGLLGVGAMLGASKAQGQVDFSALMADVDLSALTPQQLMQFFASQGAVSGKGKAGVLSAKTNVQAKAPADAALNKLQQLKDQLPPDAWQGLQQALVKTFDAGEKDLDVAVISDEELVSLLPHRELTPEELSDIVQDSGLSPYTVLNALVSTPAESPQLAAALPEDMGNAELPASTLTGALALSLGVSPSDVRDDMVSAAAGLEVAEGGGVVDVEEEGEILPLSRHPEVKQPKAQPHEHASQKTGSIVSALAKGDMAELDPATEESLPPQQREIIEKVVAALQHRAVRDTATNNQVAAVTLQGVKLEPKVEKAFEKVADPANMNAAVVAENAEGVAAPKGQQVEGRIQFAAAAAKEEVSGDEGRTQAQLGRAVVDNAQAAVTPQRGDVLQAADFRRELAAADRPAQPPVPVTEQVHVRIREALNEGSTRIEIRLNPSELGRVEVKIEAGDGEYARVQVIADKRETLEMLQRDARGLERALNEVGIKTESNSLSFNLRGDQGQQHARGGEQFGHGRQGEHQQGQQAQQTLRDLIDDKLANSEMALTYDVGLHYRVAPEAGLDISV